MIEYVTFTCPVCGRTSWNPNDVQEQWCGACHGATGHPAPPGMVWVKFVGGPDDPRGRLLPETIVEGDAYEYVVSGARYRYDGTTFVLAPLETRWRLRGISDLSGVDVTLQVDTDAPRVVEAIEAAASSNGFLIERISDE